MVSTTRCGYQIIAINVPCKPGFDSQSRHIFLTMIVFGESFNQSIENLPRSLEDLSFGRDFNQPLLNLPPDLAELSFGDRFNQDISNKLPSDLVDVYFGADFDQDITSMLVFCFVFMLY